MVCGLGDSDLGSDYGFLWNPEQVHWTIWTSVFYYYLLGSNWSFPVLTD